MRKSVRCPWRLNNLRERLLAEWEIRFYARHIGTIHERCFAQTAFALCTFGRQQMTPRRVPSQHLTARRDFKTLRYRFTCFASRNWLRHKARKIITAAAITNIRSHYFRGKPKTQMIKTNGKRLIPRSREKNLGIRFRPILPQMELDRDVSPASAGRT